MENTSRTFVEGLYSNKVSDRAPAFIFANQSIHVEKLAKWLEDHKLMVDEKGYIKITGMESKDGTKRYFVVDNYKPKEATPDDPEATPF